MTFTALEIKNQLKPKWLTISLFIQVFLLVPIYWLLIKAQLGNSLHSFASFDSRLLFLSEAFLALFIAPIAPSMSVIKARKKWRELSLTRIKSIRILLGNLIGGQFYPLLFLACSFIITSIILSIIRHIPFSIIFNAHIFLLICLFTYGAIGILCAIITNEFLFSLALTYLITAFFVGGVILATPLHNIDNLGPIKSLVLNINPIVAVCGTIHFDIFRTQYLYELAPIASSVLRYPAWYTIGLWHLILMLISLGIASLLCRNNE